MGQDEGCDLATSRSMLATSAGHIPRRAIERKPKMKTTATDP